MVAESKTATSVAQHPRVSVVCRASAFAQLTYLGVGFFASGLLLYWITSNLLTIAQQKYLYSRHPQLKAQADKDAQDKQRAADREKSKA